MWTWLNVLGFSLVPFSPEFNSGDPKVPCRFPCWPQSTAGGSCWSPCGRTCTDTNTGRLLLNPLWRADQGVTSPNRGDLDVCDQMSVMFSYCLLKNRKPQNTMVKPNLHDIKSEVWPEPWESKSSVKSTNRRNQIPHDWDQISKRVQKQLGSDRHEPSPKGQSRCLQSSWGGGRQKRRVTVMW